MTGQSLSDDQIINICTTNQWTLQTISRLPAYLKSFIASRSELGSRRRQSRAHCTVASLWHTPACTENTKTYRNNRHSGWTYLQKVDKAQCFWSARRCGAAGSSPDFSKVFSRHGASWPLSWNFLSMYYTVEANPPPPLLSYLQNFESIFVSNCLQLGWTHVFR